MHAIASAQPKETAARPWRRPMDFLSLRPSLDKLIRAWCESGQKDDDGCKKIADEVRARADKRAKRYGFSPEVHEDVAGEVMLGLLRLLRSRGVEHVRDFDKFAWRVIDNACKRQIRRDKPVWTKLKGEIVETLRGKRGAVGFALWEFGDDEMGGYENGWKGEGVRWTPRYVEFQQDDRPLRRYVDSVGRPERMPLPDLLKAIFNWLETPLPVNELATLVFHLQGLQERKSEPPPPDLPDGDIEFRRVSVRLVGVPLGSRSPGGELGHC